MPELPEVETVRRGLAPVIEGALIEKVTLNRPNLRFEFEPDFVKTLEGQRIVSIGRRAKYLIFKLDNDAFFIAHLGMSGRFMLAHQSGEVLNQSIFYHRQNEPLKHDHVYINCQQENSSMSLVYCDPRRFGFMALGKGGVNGHERLKDLGPEPLGDDLNVGYLINRLKDAKRSMKALLLDQSLIAGLGNIYVCEALYKVGISPFTSGSELVRQKSSDKIIAKLIKEIQLVLGRAIEAGGSSLNDFAQINGQPGYFQHEFSVYDRAGGQCNRQNCDGEIERVVQHQRATFYCPKCQTI